MNTASLGTGTAANSNHASSRSQDGSGKKPAQFSRPLGIDKYLYISRLALGATAEVFLAVHRGRSNFRKLCVIKKLREDLFDPEGAREAFAQECLLASRLNHPNVVQTYEVGAEEGEPFLAMEFLEGQSLRATMSAARNSPILPEFSLWVRIVAEALSGLHYLHELADLTGEPLGVVHRDVSPQNIFITYEGRVCLVDFGSAMITRTQGAKASSMLAGKLGYMAPEYVLGVPMDRRSDVFSMGVILWELLTGRPMPNQSVSPGEACLPRPRAILADHRIPPVLDAIVAQALDVDPSRRFPTAKAMREALEEWLRDFRPAPRSQELGDLMAAYFEEERQRVGQEVNRTVEVVPRAALTAAPSDASLDVFLGDQAPAGPQQEAPTVPAPGRRVPTPPRGDAAAAPFLLTRPRTSNAPAYSLPAPKGPAQWSKGKWAVLGVIVILFAAAAAGVAAVWLPH